MRNRDCVILDIDDTVADFAYDAARILSMHTRTTKYPENWKTHHLGKVYNTTGEEISRILSGAKSMYEQLKLTHPDWLNFSDYCYSIDLPIVVATARGHIFGNAEAELLTHKWLGRQGLIVREVRAMAFKDNKAELIQQHGWNPLLIVEDNPKAGEDYKVVFPEANILLYDRPANEDYLPRKLMTRVFNPTDVVVQLQLKLRNTQHSSEKEKMAAPA